MPSKIDTQIDSLGNATIKSTLGLNDDEGLQNTFVKDSDRVILDVDLNSITKKIKSGKTPLSFELAGPREELYFDSSKLKCGIVTCGGLCPGLNDVIRSIVFELHYRYDVKNIYGIKHGLEGFIPEYGHDLVELTPSKVENILNMGGSIIGSSRGEQEISEIIDSLERMNIRLLFMIGGDGTLTAASHLTEEIKKRGINIGIIGIPKTIDNDINLISKSFGFDTSVEIATDAIKGGHIEAKGYRNGIGIIKLMGRYSGFIAANAALGEQNVNFVLIPEVDFDFDGKNGLLGKLEKRLEKRSHAVIVVAEGAGQKYFDNKKRYDKSGNILLDDIGTRLQQEIKKYFKRKKIQISIKYIDPSYMIRSVPANTNDHIYCSFLGRDAVHAGMAGKTGMIIGYYNDKFVHIPLKAIAGKRKQVNPSGKLWHSVLESTGQGSLQNI
ncbi:MAG: ATP-dependent 6-phosphofructokinase [Desulfobacterales bacterium]|nr:ATP-dependent 6-phosphofructokinase [Desulfobacterales bacterium]MCP4160070.1 ATP-dependent 6-phosphofructokinase [Deltaproteobacteria bacterium]